MTARPRKPHKKSRKGCIECKRRHVKCDESRPKCVNCNVSLRHCSYEDMVSEARAFIPPSHSKKLQARNTTAQSQGAVSPPAPSTPSTHGEPASPPLNKLHLELFHHFASDILTFFRLGNDLSSGYASLEIMKSVLAAPFLMNEILGFSAFHLSVVRPDQQTFYRHHAAALQTHALAEFNTANMQVTPETCLPMLLFSSILALHMLSDKLLFRAPDFATFLADFIQSLHLHRGVRAVTSQSWALLLQSPLKALLQAEGDALGTSTQSANECASLLSLLLGSTPLDPTTRTTYTDTIKHLQSAFDASHLHPTGFSTARPDHLRRPEALVILAYFGALLHLHCDMWTFGDGGAFIVNTVAEYLGPGWSGWLRWPKQLIRSSAGGLF
ncbi:hypothetical protein BJX64DRAFT_277696 [Aspergillus heterothallicus]